jgi:5'-3' exonuclease
MVDPSSPIIEFFPTEYEFLLDAKGREWRNIALIPFIDQSKLIQVRIGDWAYSLWLVRAR